MRFRLLFYVTFLGLSNAFAQDIEVKKFEPLEQDQTAMTRPRKDINGNACGLVKVVMKEAGAEFEGNVIGDVQYTGTEYMVYMPNGTKRLSIKHPDYLPTTIMFADYGTKRIASSTTYNLILKTHNKKQKETYSKTQKKMVCFDITPNDSQLFIDDESIPNDGDGAYTVSLNHGVHYYSVKSDFFCIYNQIIKVNRKTNIVRIDLTEFCPYLQLSALTKETNIYINNKLCGKEKWQGLVPPGKYLVEARKEGYATQAKTFELNENDSLCVYFNEMSPVTGSLKVNYWPDGSEVIVDGKTIGVTPLYINDIPVGEHRISIKYEGLSSELKFIRIEEDQELTLEGRLHYLLKK